MKITNKLFISVLFLSGIIFNLTVTTFPVFSQESYSFSNDKQEVKGIKSNDDKHSEDKEKDDDNDNDEKNENHHNH